MKKKGCKKGCIGILLFISLTGLIVYLVLKIVFLSNTLVYDGERSVNIPPGSTLSSIIDSLTVNEILDTRFTFKWMASLTGWGDQVKAGHYSFEAGKSNYELLNTLRKGLQTPIRLTIPPGSRPSIIAAVASRDMAFTADDFLAALADPGLAAKLGTDTTRLFGYMLPETYHVYWLTSARDVVRRIKREFDRFYLTQIAEGARKYNLNPDEAIIVAGIIEWETGITDEKPRVAGVYLNRLRRGIKLDADPTVQYVILEREGQKRRLLYRDYRIEHPYNTYLFRGLPPGPITNPSPSSLRAVANAEEHDYIFFVASGDGGHTFSRTLAEHNRAAQRFHQLMRQRRAEAAQSQ